MEAEADGDISDGIRVENHELKFFRSSVKHWEAIIQDLNKTIEETKTENEWKARYVEIHIIGREYGSYVKLQNVASI